MHGLCPYHSINWEEDVRQAVVIAGIDEAFVYLHDPFFPEAPQTVSHPEFQLAWDEMDNTFAILSLSPQG